MTRYLAGACMRGANSTYKRQMNDVKAETAEKCHRFSFIRRFLGILSGIIPNYQQILSYPATNLCKSNLET